ncbi:TetR/AcrR family transcriptional regulator [Streptomyces sp. A7024]|uniref:TetR/AcrR family transcriptional regulator n=1 Tax=Streptomyces coryli TaxID=1128680 RepID=A0A6G4UC18_9ACTN|nr:TetR/AcrR family transcriptional regulator [Streptomyces coryli]
MSTDTALPRQRASRRDASRNRIRIVEAARQALVEYGTDVPLDEVARRAGVGNATVYRHFDGRRDLLLAVMLHSMERIAEEAESAYEEVGHPFEALRRFVLRAADERIGSLCPLLAEGFDKGAPPLADTHDRLDRAIVRLMDRAKEAGQLRGDVAVGDLMVALSQLTRPLPGSECTTFDQFVQRHLQLFLDGLQAPARSELPGHAATLEDLRQKREPGSD